MLVLVRWAGVQQVVSCGYSAEEIFGGVSARVPGHLVLSSYRCAYVPMYLRSSTPQLLGS